MTDLQTLKKILSYKEAGYNQSKVSRLLGINRKTVRKYWHIEHSDTLEDIFYKVNRFEALASHEDEIVKYIRQEPTITSKKICELIFKHFGENYSHRTVSRYVEFIRYDYYLEKDAFHSYY